MIRNACLLTLVASLVLPAALVAQNLAIDTPNSELIRHLATELDSSNEQAIGAAGALFGLARTRMKPIDFSRLTASVPGMNRMLAAAPATSSMPGQVAAGADEKPRAVAQATEAPGRAGGASGLATVAGAFTALGLKPELAAKAVPVLTSYVTKTGGSELATLLAGALK